MHSLWLEINERKPFKVPSLVYYVLRTNQPIYLRNFLTIQPSCLMYSFLVYYYCLLFVIVCFSASLKGYFFSLYSYLWKYPPEEFEQPAGLSSDTIFLPLAVSSAHQFHSKLKTFLFTHSYRLYALDGFFWFLSCLDFT